MKQHDLCHATWIERVSFSYCYPFLCAQTFLKCIAALLFVLRDLRALRAFVLKKLAPISPINSTFPTAQNINDA